MTKSTLDTSSGLHYLDRMNVCRVNLTLAGGLMLVSVVAAQTDVDTSALTNAPTPYSATIIVPQPFAPPMNVAQPTRILIPSINNVPTTRPVPRPPRPPMPLNAFGPSPNDLARRNFRAPPVAFPQPRPAATAFVAHASTPVSLAQVYVVAPSGSDANRGTTTAPWRTLQYAAAQVQPGDTVIVQPGFYEAFRVGRGGERLKPITFRAEGNVVVIPAGEDPPTDVKGIKPAVPSRRDNISVKDANYVVIDGFTVRYAARAGISVLDSRGVVVKNNVCGPNGVWGIFTGFAPEVQIISNKTFSSKQQHGIYVSNSRDPDDNPVIAWNECWDNGASGVQVNGDCECGGDGMIDGALIEGNIIHDNDLKGFSLISIRNGRIQNNLLYNNGRRAGAGGIHLTDQLGCGKGSATNVVVNNTIVEPRIAGIRITDGASQNIVFNNLIVSRQPIRDEVGANKIDNVSNVTRDSATGVFLNPANGDYRLLLPGSPAATKGLLLYHGQTAPLLDREGRRRPSTFGLDAGAY